MRSSRAPRVARGLVAASFATFLALMSHIAGGGTVPGWLGIAVPWVLSAAVCTVLAGRALSLTRLSIAVAVSQVLFHVLFVLGMPTAVVVASPGAHDHGAMTMPAISTMPATAMIADTTMWVWHAVAAFLTIALLYRGERSFGQLRVLAVRAVRWIRRRLDTFVPVAAVFAHRRLPVFSPQVVAPLGVPARSLRRRGPPSLHAL